MSLCNCVTFWTYLQSCVGVCKIVTVLQLDGDKLPQLEDNVMKQVRSACRGARARACRREMARASRPPAAVGPLLAGIAVFLARSVVRTIASISFCFLRYERARGRTAVSSRARSVAPSRRFSCSLGCLALAPIGAEAWGTPSSLPACGD